MIDTRLTAILLLFSTGTISAGTASVLLIAAPVRDPVYTIAPDQMRATLAETEVPLFVLGNSAKRSTTSQQGDNRVVWTVIDNDDRQWMHIVATTTPADQGIGLHLEIAPPDGPRHDEMARTIADKPAIANLYRTAMAEQIDAALNHRKFAMSHLYGAMAATITDIVPALWRSSDRTSRAAGDDDKANIAQAYAREAQPVPSAPGT